MNLGELAQGVSRNIFDFYDTAFTASEKRQFVNEAMHWAGASLAGTNTNYMLKVWRGEVTNPGNDPYVLVDTGTVTTPGVVRIVRARRTDSNTTGDDRSLEIIEFQDAEKKAWGSALARPQIFQFNFQFGFVRPVLTGFEAEVVYVHQLVDMTMDTDTPGEQDGLGERNAIPETFHPLIITYASMLALTAQNANAQQMQMRLQEQLQAFGLRAQLSRSVQETPRANLR